jgi:hypothetical protein
VQGKQKTNNYLEKKILRNISTPSAHSFPTPCGVYGTHAKARGSGKIVRWVDVVDQMPIPNRVLSAM